MASIKTQYLSDFSIEDRRLICCECRRALSEDSRCDCQKGIRAPEDTSVEWVCPECKESNLDFICNGRIITCQYCLTSCSWDTLLDEPSLAAANKMWMALSRRRWEKDIAGVAILQNSRSSKVEEELLQDDDHPPNRIFIIAVSIILILFMIALILIWYIVIGTQPATPDTAATIKRCMESGFTERQCSYLIETIVYPR